MYSGSERLDRTVPPPWERICTVPAQRAPPGVFPSTRKTERHSSRPPHLVLPALTGNQRHLRASTRLQASAPRRWKNKKKRSPTQTRSGERPGARHSSELLCFQLVPLFLRRGNVFVQMTNWTSSLSPGYFDRSGKKEELLENVEL